MNSERHSIEEPDNRDVGGDSSEVFAGLPEERLERRDVIGITDENTRVSRDSLARRPKLEALRRDLADASRKQFVNSGSPVGEQVSFDTVRRESVSRKPAGRVRRWVHLAMAGLGLLGADKLQAADSSSSVQAKPDAIVAGVPVFKAPMQSSSGTNVYNYEGEIWKPKTEEEKERMAKAKASLEAQKAAAAANPGFSVTAAPTFENNSGTVTEEPRRTIRMPNTPRGGGQPLGYGGGYGVNRMGGGNFSRFGNQNGAGIFVEAGIRTPPNYPDVVYHSVPAPTEERKLFGVKFPAATRDAALRGRGLGSSESRVPLHSPKKPKSR